MILTGAGANAEEFRQCRQCGQWLPITRYKARKGGGIGSTCRPCINERARESHHARREAAGKPTRRIWPDDRGGQRMCRACEQWLSVDDFSPTTHNNAGRSSYCRPCGNRRNVEASALKAAEEGREIRPLRTGFPDDRDGQRMCRDCEQWSALTDFPPQETRKSGHGSYCRPCMNVRTQASYAKKIMKKENREVRKPELLPEGQKRCPVCDEVKALNAFVQASAKASGVHSYCKPCFNVKAGESVEKHHGSTRNVHLKRRYGLTDADVEAMLDAQYGVCAICKQEHSSYHVDHDHLTGKVRGILCFKCNNALGLFQEDYHRMRSAMEYLLDNAGVDDGTWLIVPEAERDPRGTWIKAAAEREAEGLRQARRLHSMFGVPDEGNAELG